MKASYREILHSTSLVGGSQVVNILIGIVRGKALALLIGPSGVGLAGMLQSSVGFIEVLAGMGLRQAGVRQVAVAFGSGDMLQMARSATVLRRASLVSAVVGMTLVFAFRGPIAQLTFGDQVYATSIGLMGLTLFFGAINSGQSALIQGTRRVHLLAISAVVSTAMATVCGLVPVLLMGEKGIALMHVTGAAVACAVVVLIARRVDVARIRLSLQAAWTEASELLRLGTALMAAGLVAAAGVYVTHVLIARGFGTSGVGLYLAAGTLSTFYVKMILSAMGADFYPRISALIHAPSELNRVVNEQVQVGILLAVPGVLFTLTFAPWILRILASPEFTPATPIARWQIMGAAIQALSWPMGYIILAQGRSWLYLCIETVTVVVGIVLLIVCMALWGLAGAGMASLLLYAAYAAGIVLITRRLCGFSLTRKTRRIVLWRLAFVGALYVWLRMQPGHWGWIGGIVLTGGVSLASLRTLTKLTGLRLRELPSLLYKRG